MDKKISVIKKWLGTGSINIFGSPLAGKDTQGQKLASALKGELIGGGAILRSDNMPDYIKEAMTTGELIPPDDYLSIVMPYLSRDEFKDKPLVLNSIGRWHGEEDAVLYATERSGHPVKAVVFLKIDEKDVTERLQQARELKDRGQRVDDTNEKLDVRLREFRDKTMPVIDSYRELGYLVEVDGTQSKEKVFEEMIDKLHKLASHA